MERERGVVEQPAAKRVRMMAEVQGNRMLRQATLALLFLVRMSVRTSDTVTASFSQIRDMMRHLDRTLYKYHEMTSRQIEGLQHEVARLTRLCSNCHAEKHTRLEANKEHDSANGSNTSIRLNFLNDLKLPIYKGKNITAENNTGIKVAMYEGEQMITSGLLSKVKLEILVLRGEFATNYRDNWTEEEFEKHIVQGRDGKGLVLGTAWLTNGVAELSQIRFTEGSCWKEFIMAARVCKGEKISGRVREAIMKPVKVLDGRNEANEKSRSPRLYEDVYRLEEIAKDGVYHDRLQKANIQTVQDFLKALNKDSDELCEVLQMKKTYKSWLKMTNHARKCVLEDMQWLKAYETEDKKAVFFFDCVHYLVGAAFACGYVAREGFDPVQKALVDKWKRQAYSQLDDIQPSYVMQDNIPVPASPGTGLAASMIVPSCPFPLHQETPKHGQQEIASPPIGPGWQTNPNDPMHSPDISEWLSMIGMIQDPSAASTSAHPNFESHHLPQLHQTVPTAAPAGPTAAEVQPFGEQEQAPGYPPFPGPGHSNDCY